MTAHDFDFIPIEKQNGRFSLDEWWEEQYEVHPMCTAEYWQEQQCSLEKLNEWIKNRKEVVDDELS
tara:strand:- start:145 stop:342 length:198 start_codon:yes stop_codon:yes gene_type:complete